MKRLMKEEKLNPKSVENDSAGYVVVGGFELDWLKVISTPANHTSNTSLAVGTIAILDDGFTLHHCGDSSITAEMEIYGRLFPIDIAFVPIFQQSIMGYIQATEAVRLLNPKKVFQIHFDFNKNPEYERDRFVEYCREKNPHIEVIRTEIDKWYEV